MLPAFLSNRRRLAIVAALALFAGLVGGFALFRRPPRVQMARYVPASALAHLEIDNLTDLLDGLTDTRAWRYLAPELGLSSQLRQIGLATDLISRTGLGPREIVAVGRAQYAVVLTGLDVESIESEQVTRVKPLFTLIVETHGSPEDAAHLVRERASILARRVYGDPAETREEYAGASITNFKGEGASRQIVATSHGSSVLLSNDGGSIRACLDTLAGRAPSLATDERLGITRSEIADDSVVFAYVSKTGLEKLVEFGSALLASRMTGDAEGIASLAGLLTHLSKQVSEGFAYAAVFEDGGVTERYLTVLRPEVAEALSGAMAPLQTDKFRTLDLIPPTVEDVTLLNIESAADLPLRLLQNLSPRVDTVAGLALREVVLGFNRQLSLDPGESLSSVVDGEVAMVRPGNDEPMVLLMGVRDRTRLDEVVRRYLSAGGEIEAAQHAGSEILASSASDRRAAAFVGSVLVLGTLDQLRQILDARVNPSRLSNEALTRALQGASKRSSIISIRPDQREAGELMLSIAALTRVGDGSREMLEGEGVKAALSRLSPTISLTEFRSDGVYTESRSAVGSFSLLAGIAED